MALPRPAQLAPSTALVLDKMRQGSSTNTLSVSNTSPLSEGEALIEINDSSAEHGQRLSEDQCNTFMLRTSMGFTAMWLAVTAILITESIRHDENLFETPQLGLPYFIFSVLTWIINAAVLSRSSCSQSSLWRHIEATPEAIPEASQTDRWMYRQLP